MVDLRSLATAIAAHLPHWQGKAWDAVYESDFYRIKHPDGPWLTLHTWNHPKKQVSVCGAFSTAPGTEHSFEDLCRRINDAQTLQVKSGINVSPERDPKVLASDIQRRLLSVYLPLYEQGLAAKQSRLESLNAKEALLKQLATELGVSTHGGSLACQNFWVGLDLWGEISVNSPTSLTVKLVGLTPEQWSRVLTLLRTPTPTTPSPHDGT